MNHLLDGLLTLMLIAAAVMLLTTAPAPAPPSTQDAAEIRTHLLHADGTYGSLRADIAVATVTRLMVDDERISPVLLDAPVVMPPNTELRCVLADPPANSTAVHRWGHRRGPAASIAVMTIPLPEAAPRLGTNRTVQQALRRVYGVLADPSPTVDCVVTTAR
jgi:hypothetical protein